MAAHLYWRLNIAAVDGGTLIGIAEIEMRTSPGGANVATGGTATAAAEQVGSEASKAFDANGATNWLITAAVTTGWVRYQFASAQDIVEHAITAANATPNRTPKNWIIQWSDDGSNWTTAAIVAGQEAWTASEQRVFTHASWPVNVGRVLTPIVSPSAGPAAPPAFSTVLLAHHQAALQTSPMISGTVMQGGVPCARTVRAYRRLDNQFLGEAVSDAGTGAFTINSRGRADHCYVVALDDLTGDPDFNAQIFDLVLPV